MTGQIDENVDLVTPNALGKLSVAHAASPAPTLCEALQPTRDGIGQLDFGVAKSFDLVGIVVSQYRFEVAAQGVVAEVGGNITDTQGAMQVVSCQSTVVRG